MVSEISLLGPIEPSESIQVACCFKPSRYFCLGMKDNIFFKKKKTAIKRAWNLDSAQHYDLKEKRLAGPLRTTEIFWVPIWNRVNAVRVP